MLFVKRVSIAQTERGLLFRERDLVRVLSPGIHWIVDPANRQRVHVVSTLAQPLHVTGMDEILLSGKLDGLVQVLDVADHERALLWVEGHFRTILGPGRHALWTVAQKCVTEVVDIRAARFEHPALQRILRASVVGDHLGAFVVEAHQRALMYLDGKLIEELGPGTHVYWKDTGRYQFRPADLRERSVDVAGQEIMTADRVTLRMNAIVTFRVTDVVKALTTAEDAQAALYRESQLALRAAVGTRELESLLADKDAVAKELLEALKARGESLGIAVLGFGIRDIILPGEMKELLNRVTEAKKAAEAATITRREETASIRHQANTAKVFENNPTLLRLRELETLEKISAKANLTVISGEKGGLVDQIVKMV